VASDAFGEVVPAASEHQVPGPRFGGLMKGPLEGAGTQVHERMIGGPFNGHVGRHAGAVDEGVGKPVGEQPGDHGRVAAAVAATPHAALIAI